MECPICLESKLLIKTVCNHFFCNKCLEKIKICALCRNILYNNQEKKYNINYFKKYISDKIMYFIYYLYTFYEYNNIMEIINDIHERIHVH